MHKALRRRADVLAVDKNQVFAANLVRLVMHMGSSFANEFWEARLDPLRKITSAVCIAHSTGTDRARSVKSPSEERGKFIEEKYFKKCFCQYSIDV